MIKTILVLVDEPRGFEATLTLAVELGQHFAAHLDVLHVRDDPSSQTPFADEGISAPTIKAAVEEQIESRESRARAIFDRLCAASDVSANWLVAAGEALDIVATAGRLADLVVIGRPYGPDNGSWRATLDAVLFNSGRPVLLLPRAPPPLLGEPVALAWNGSVQAAHAVVAALPFLRLAKRVTVLTAGAIAPYASTTRLIAYLARHDIQAIAREFELGHIPLGQALLEQTKLSKATLLVMGAYGHSRLRETILGGPTRQVLAAIDLPVLMAH